MKFIVFCPQAGRASKASCDAFYYNLVLHIEGIALHGSFLLPLRSGFAWIMQNIKGAKFSSADPR
ncbi:MAG: hypothetical protein KBH06_11645, partial [Spirochaetes bacterium]|nr:hypothetical protein [Spirochaetota bacterium]